MPAKYDQIGKGYNRTRKADPFLTHNLIRHLRPPNTGTYLDIGCGTGNYTHQLQNAGYQMIGIDPAQKMLDQARALNAQVDWRLASAEQTHLESASVEGIVATLTIHHWQKLELAFKELYRVLKPGGRMVIFTSTPKQMQGYWLNAYFPQMLTESIKQMPAEERLSQALIKAGFLMKARETYFIQPDLQDKFLYCGKHAPEIYFDASIQAGISSFSSLANQEEVSRGLIDLQGDIDSGRILEVMTAYANQLGDYLYLILEKS